MIKIEYSKNLDKAKIANVSVGINGKKIVRLYEHNENDKFKVNDTTEDDETLKIMHEDKCLAELIFYHDESIDSLIRVLEALKNRRFINAKDDPELYKELSYMINKKSNLELFAERELEILLEKCKDDEESIEMQKHINNDILEIVKIFAEQGHSGFSANYAINLIEKLLRYEPITPLTGDNREWEKLEYSKNDICYQNKRCPRVFKDKDGKAYDVEGRIFSDNNGQTWYTSKDSKVFIDFPYRPKTEEVIVSKDNKIGE